MMNRDVFKRSYIATALWSTNDESTESGGFPLDDNYDPEDIAPESLAKMHADCDKFCDALEVPWAHGEDAQIDDSQAGHDFWLTRNGHGAGFWDGDYPEEQGERLTELSKKFGEVYLYVGDDGHIYC